MTIGNVKAVDDSAKEAWASEEAVGAAETGAVGTGTRWGTGDKPDIEGAGVADEDGSLIAKGGGGTGTGMGLISNFSGSIGLPMMCEIPFANNGIVSKMTTHASARHKNAMRIQWVERVVFMGTLLLKR